MAAPGGRRTRHVAVHLSWPEADAWEALRALDSHRAGRPLSRADWLMHLVEPRLREASDQPNLPSYLRTRCSRAVEALEAERSRSAPHQLGRPPNVW